MSLQTTNDSRAGLIHDRRLIFHLDTYFSFSFSPIHLRNEPTMTVEKNILPKMMDW